MNANYITVGDQVYGFDELVTANIAAKIIGYTARTIQDKASAREIPIHKCGRLNKFLIRDLIELQKKTRILLPSCKKTETVV